MVEDQQQPEERPMFKKPRYDQEPLTVGDIPSSSQGSGTTPLEQLIETASAGLDDPGQRLMRKLSERTGTGASSARERSRSAHREEDFVAHLMVGVEDHETKKCHEEFKEFRGFWADRIESDELTAYLSSMNKGAKKKKSLEKRSKTVNINRVDAACQSLTRRSV